HNPVAAPKSIKVQVRLKNTGALSWTTSGANSAQLGVHVFAPDGTQSNILGLSLGGTVASGATTTVTVSIPPALERASRKPAPTTLASMYTSPAAPSGSATSSASR